jgi:hypothetical protein
LNEDGSVHELTVSTITQVKKLIDNRAMSEQTLHMLGDGNWKLQKKVHEEVSAKQTILGHYCADIINSLTQVIDSASKGYRRPGLAAVFLVNNYNYVATCVKSQNFIDELGEQYVTKYDRLLKKLKDNYMDSWNPLLQHLSDPQSLKGGVRGNLSTAEKNAIKEKFKSFNAHLDETYKEHSTYDIPDPALRDEMIQRIHKLIIPKYDTFVEKYRSTDFAKNQAKYIVHTPEALKALLNKLFESRMGKSHAPFIPCLRALGNNWRKCWNKSFDTLCFPCHIGQCVVGVEDVVHNVTQPSWQQHEHRHGPHGVRANHLPSLHVFNRIHRHSADHHHIHLWKYCLSTVVDVPEHVRCEQSRRYQGNMYFVCL